MWGGRPRQVSHGLIKVTAGEVKCCLRGHQVRQTGEAMESHVIAKVIKLT